MQIHQRMDLDQANEMDHHPIKPLNCNENSNQIAMKENVQNNKKQRGRKRAFGQDLTNQHRSKSNQQNNQCQQPKVDGYNFLKPQIVVVKNQKNASKEQQQQEITECAQQKKVKKKLKRKLTSEMDEIHKEGFKEEQQYEGEGEGESNDDDDEDNDIEMIEIKERELSPWDVSDIDSDLHVTDYVDDIMKNLKTDEISNFNGCIIENEYDFMANQDNINQRMRTVLVDWLIEVHRKFKLLPSTYFLGINILDRYLAKKQTHRKQLQLAGCTCLWIASKYHEIYAPEMDDFVYISDSAFTAEDLERMEIDILKELSFTLTVPTVLNYAQRYSKISSYYLKKEREIKIISDLIMYCIEHCVMSYTLCRKLPSLIGAASFVYSCLSTKVFSMQTFKEDNLENVIGYKLDELIPVMNTIHSTVKNAKKSKHKAVHKKYCNPKYSNIGKLNFDKLHTSFLKQ